MHQVLLAAAALLTIAGCEKKNDSGGRAPADLTIIQTQSPTTVAQGQPIVTRVKSQAPNLCYQFDHMEVQATAAREFAIRSLGTVPKADAVCGQALLQVDTTVSIPATMAGQYILRFYNGSNLFRADTVQAY